MTFDTERIPNHGPDNAPDYPENAETFILVEGSHLFATSAVRNYEGEIPDDVERTRNGGARFPAGAGIPADLVDDSTWRATWRNLVPLDADGEPLEILPTEEKEPTPREQAIETYRQQGESK